jgi:hypothetical protein
LSPDKDYYEKGETANLLFSWTPSADGFPGSRSGKSSEMPEIVVSGEITNKLDFKCAELIKITIAKDEKVLRKEIPVSIVRSCINSQLKLSFTDSNGNILDPKTFSFKTNEEPPGPQTVLDSSDVAISETKTIINNVMAGNTTGSGSVKFKAPSTALTGQTGNYKVKFTATSYSIAGQKLVDSDNNILKGVNAKRFIRQSNNHTLSVSIDGGGSITDVGDITSGQSHTTLNSGDILADQASPTSLFTVANISGGAIGTATRDISFTVPPPTVDVFVNNSNVSPQSANSGSNLDVKWYPQNANKCSCQCQNDSGSPISCGDTGRTSCGDNIPASYPSYSPYNPITNVTQKTIFKVICNNN